MRRNAPAAGRATRGRLASRRLVLALLILPPLIALGLLAWATLSHHPHPVRTGDALLDAHLQELGESYGSFITKRHAGSDYLLIEQQFWQAAEQQFADDPRYWVLCYQLRQCIMKSNNGAIWCAISALPGELDTARERGAADWIVLVNLLQFDCADWYSQAVDSLGITRPSPGSTEEEHQSHHARVWQEVLSERGAEVEQRLDELRRVGEDQAQVHYFLAGIAAERGAMAEAIYELAAGNAAPRNDGYVGFLFDLLTAAASRGQALADDSLATSLLAVAYGEVSIPIIWFEDLSGSVANWAVKRSDLTALQILHRSCCRYGMSAGLGQMHASVAARADAGVLGAIRTLSRHSSAVSLQALNTAQQQFRQIYGAIQQIDTAAPYSPAAPTGLAKFLEYIPAIHCGGQYAMLDNLRGYSRDLIREQTALAGPIRQQFEALAALDFTR